MALLLIFGFSRTGFSGELLNYDLTPRPVAPDTYVLEGSIEHFSRDNGGNILNTGFIITANGVVVIDTGPSRLYGEQLKQVIAEVTDKPIERIYNTHHHPDHFFGNQAFSKHDIWALAGTINAAREEGEGLSDNMYLLAGDWMLGTEVLLPNTVAESSTIEVGGHQLELLALSGHTGADLVIFDRTTGVLFAGDLVFNQRAPTTPHADIPTWLRSLERLKKMQFAVLVPGHGPVATDTAPIDATADYLRWLDGALRQAAERGMDPAELLDLDVPERFQHFAVLRQELRRSVTHLYPAMEKAALGVK
jgi:quinoprotein relay system zinc metallohydrolase 1